LSNHWLIGIFLNLVARLLLAVGKTTSLWGVDLAGSQQQELHDRTFSIDASLMQRK
jgi:hypothetical protein